jgi:hypothetical protein
VLICDLVLGIWNLILSIRRLPGTVSPMPWKKASPPHVAGGVFFLGGGYGYIKGGEMERLINIGIFIGLFCRFFGRGVLLVLAAFLLIVGDVPARALELE